MKYDKKLLDATPQSMTHGTDTMADNHTLDKTRAGKRYDKESEHDD
jgi:hypothetical protein